MIRESINSKSVEPTSLPLSPTQLGLFRQAASSRCLLCPLHCVYCTATPFFSVTDAQAGTSKHAGACFPWPASWLIIASPPWLIRLLCTTNLPTG